LFSIILKVYSLRGRGVYFLFEYLWKHPHTHPTHQINYLKFISMKPMTFYFSMYLVQEKKRKEEKKGGIWEKRRGEYGEKKGMKEDLTFCSSLAAARDPSTLC
jgi:hypothetical protein